MYQSNCGVVGLQREFTEVMTKRGKTLFPMLRHAFICPHQCVSMTLTSISLASQLRFAPGGELVNPLAAYRATMNSVRR